MKRREFLKTTGQGALLSTILTRQVFSDQKSTHPNIILIMADDMGHECLSCYGSLDYQTPRLDQLAKTGIQFTQCHAQPLCTPSRVKIMTGLHNFRNYDAFGYLNPDQRTFAQVLKDAGYATCIAGKWQLNGIYKNKGDGPKPGWEDNSRPHHFGFDEYCLWQLTKEKKLGERYANPLIEQNGSFLIGLEEQYGPDIFVNFIIDFIQHHQNQPFLIYYPMALVHAPFVPTPASEEWVDKNRRYQSDPKFFKDMVEYSDKIIGQLVDALEKLGLRENTVLMFTGDNGTDRRITTRTVNGPITGGKGTTTAAATHVPLIVNWPAKIRVGQVYEELIDLSDFFPTLADIAGIKVQSDGQSFYNLLIGELHQPRETVLIHYDPKWPFGEKHRNRFVLTKAYKLYQDGRFFAVKKDPLEQQPLILEKCSSDEIGIYHQLKAVLAQVPPWIQQEGGERN